MNSISRFLLISLLAAMAVITGAASLWSYRDATHEVEELFDAELAQMARVLQSLLDAQLKHASVSPLVESLEYRPYLPAGEDDGDEATRFGHKYEKKLAFRVWNAEGQELISSHSGRVELVFTRQPGFAYEHIEGHGWRTFAMQDDQLNIWIKVAQRDDVREELTGEIVRNTLLPLMLMIPVLALVIGWIVRRGLSPLRRISHQLVARSPENLEPLDNRSNPAEVDLVVTALNGLLGKLAEAVERERRFTADAAHELRTPLAGIRIHAQNLQQQSAAGPEPGLTPIIQGVDRMSHVVEQLLTLSKLEYRQGAKRESVDLCALARTAMAGLAPLALAKSQTLELECPQSVPLTLQATAIDTLCRNLIDNAIRYTPAHGAVLVTITEGAGRVSLTVSDTGPGIDVADRERVLERFYRLAGQDIVGSGLGLAIVREIAEQHGATVTLSDSPLAAQGLRVRVDFPCEPA